MLFERYDRGKRGVDAGKRQSEEDIMIAKKKADPGFG
jgi:hypothetical protein